MQKMKQLFRSDYNTEQEVMGLNYKETNLGKTSRRIS